MFKRHPNALGECTCPCGKPKTNAPEYPTPRPPVAYGKVYAEPRTAPRMAQFHGLQGLGAVPAGMVLVDPNIAELACASWSPYAGNYDVNRFAETLPNDVTYVASKTDLYKITPWEQQGIRGATVFRCTGLDKTKLPGAQPLPSPPPGGNTPPIGPVIPLPPGGKDLTKTGTSTTTTTTTSSSKLPLILGAVALAAGLGLAYYVTRPQEPEPV